MVQKNIMNNGDSKLTGIDFGADTNDVNATDIDDENATDNSTDASTTASTAADGDDDSSTDPPAMPIPLGGRTLLALLGITSFACAELCGLAIGVHLCLVGFVFQTFQNFMAHLCEQIVNRQISRESELESLMCRADNLLRFVFFARMRLTALGWLVFLASFTVNISVVLLFCRFDVGTVRNILLFGNQVINNLLSTFLILVLLALLGIYIISIKMDFRFHYIHRLLSLESCFPNPVNPQMQRLAQGLLERLEQANNHQKGLHQLQMIFAAQFFPVFAIIGLLNHSLMEIGIFLGALLSICLILYFRAFQIIKLFSSKEMIIEHSKA